MEISKKQIRIIERGQQVGRLVDDKLSGVVLRANPEPIFKTVTNSHKNKF